MSLPVWQDLYESIGPDRFELISVAQDSGSRKAVEKWFDRASPTFRCVIDPTHQISSLFGWVNVPSAAWIDEEGTIVRSNEGVYPGETTIRFGLGKVRSGDSSFADATRDWIERGADSEHVWSSRELAKRLKPVDDDTRLAEATFKLALHFEAVGDSERALKHFAAAQRLAPDNWNYQRQGWSHRGALHAALKVLRRTNHLRKNSDKSFYDPTGCPARITAGSSSRSGCGRPPSGGQSNCSAVSEANPEDLDFDWIHPDDTKPAIQIEVGVALHEQHVTLGVLDHPPVWPEHIDLVSSEAGVRNVVGCVRHTYAPA